MAEHSEADLKALCRLARAQGLSSIRVGDVEIHVSPQVTADDLSKKTKRRITSPQKKQQTDPLDYLDKILEKEGKYLDQWGRPRKVQGQQ